MNKLITVVIALLLAIGCADVPEEQQAVTAPVVLTSEERADIAIQAAIASWTDAVGWAPAVDAVRFEEPDSDKDRTAAMWSAETRTLIIVPVRIGDNQTRWNMIVMHELGHAYGLGHSASPTALMNELPKTSACVHEDDARALRALDIEAHANCGAL